MHQYFTIIFDENSSIIDIKKKFIEYNFFPLIIRLCLMEKVSEIQGWNGSYDFFIVQTTKGTSETMYPNAIFLR